MILLALDTTTRAGSAALARDGRLVEERAGDPGRPHGVRLPGDLVALLRAHNLRPADVDLYGVASGPGSFTGLRVGVAAIQGFALVNNRRVVPVSTLDALAFAARALHGGDLGPDARIGAWVDAQRGEVFAAMYPARGRLEAVEPPTAGRPDALLDRAARSKAGGAPVWFIGDGAERYREAIATRLGDAARIVVPTPLLAWAVAQIAAERADGGGAVAPHAIRPVYVRRPDAELARGGRADAMRPQGTEKKEGHGV